MGKSEEDFGRVFQEREQSPWLQQVLDNSMILSDIGQCGWAFLGVLCCSALVSSVVELVAAVTADSSESHCVQAGQAPKVQHGREVPGIIAEAGLDSGFSVKDFGLIGNAGLAVPCLTFAAWPVFPGTRVC